MHQEKNVEIFFYVTVDHERYRSIAFNLIRSADGVMLMYDITKKETFNPIPKWLQNFRENKGNDFPITLIGNKLDLKEEREV